MKLKGALQRVAHSLGYHVSKLPTPPPFEPHLNPFADLRELFGNCPPKVIFDLGAHEGHLSEKYLSIFPDSQIFAFEPSYEAFAILSKRFEHTPKVTCSKTAVASQTGSAQLFLNRFNQTNSLLPAAPEVNTYLDAELVENLGTAQVDTITLDDFCRSNAIKRINLLKMDVQGGELMVLEGAQKLLSEGAIEMIYTEVNFVNLYKDQVGFHELSDYLSKHGFALYGFYYLSYGKNGMLAWSDALFLHPGTQMPPRGQS